MYFFNSHEIKQCGFQEARYQHFHIADAQYLKYQRLAIEHKESSFYHRGLNPPVWSISGKKSTDILYNKCSHIWHNREQQQPLPPAAKTKENQYVNEEIWLSELGRLERQKLAFLKPSNKKKFTSFLLPLYKLSGLLSKIIKWFTRHNN